MVLGSNDVMANDEFGIITSKALKRLRKSKFNPILGGVARNFFFFHAMIREIDLIGRLYMVVKGRSFPWMLSCMKESGELTC